MVLHGCNLAAYIATKTVVSYDFYVFVKAEHEASYAEIAAYRCFKKPVLIAVGCDIALGIGTFFREQVV